MKMKITPLGVITFFVVLFVVSPLLVIIPTSLTSVKYLSFPPVGFSFDWYLKILDRQEFVDSFFFSIQLAALTAVIATLVGTLAGIALHKYKFPGRNVINGLLLSPLTVPALIIGIAALLFFTRIGLAGTFIGLLLAHVLISIPYVVRLVLTGLSAYDYTLERAAYIMGANSVNV
ncbi:MAG: spermidine/putrescine transporter ATP-binding protein, partial [Paenibacillus sp.]|nr:spermidine/putrescine transporter ATP-binding protein [Paenibacillus sp.]